MKVDISYRYLDEDNKHVILSIDHKQYLNRTIAYDFNNDNVTLATGKQNGVIKNLFVNGKKILIVRARLQKFSEGMIRFIIQ